ncbi:PaaI family thioesterase [Sphingomonas jeddahensis]|uniref:Thioesterase superfamily protein n=1 Tax=Sphingomonas jeddahensis TaxID=1915074 RepID=A0A1V2EW79_9SPHN|nr:PaaI family thioesterase [Sphingomonas jeddahensis]ONF96538.1 Thioesterase superfamily protein [Sphingomonas jeddahensis]
MDTTTTPETRLLPVTEGEWAGWLRWPGTDPFEDHTGPFFARYDAGGVIECGFRPEAKNSNGGGNVHGGALLTFADFALFMIASAVLPEFHGVTATLNAEFVGAARPSRLLTARGEVVKAGRSLIFVRGTIDDEGAAVMSFSGVIKRITRYRPAGGAD